MPVRGIRGATTVTDDVASEVLTATRELLQEIFTRNGITDFSEIVSVIFTTTPDLKSVFPAEAARELGMAQVPLLCASEIAVPGALPKVIRVLLQINTSQTQSEMQHLYLRDAQKLRKDLSGAQ